MYNSGKHHGTWLWSQLLTGEVETGEALKPRSSRAAWAKQWDPELKKEEEEEEEEEKEQKERN
jgi:hypothetical protein